MDNDETIIVDLEDEVEPIQLMEGFLEENSEVSLEEELAIVNLMNLQSPAALKKLLKELITVFVSKIDGFKIDPKTVPLFSTYVDEEMENVYEISLGILDDEEELEHSIVFVTSDYVSWQIRIFKASLDELVACVETDDSIEGYVYGEFELEDDFFSEEIEV